MGRMRFTDHAPMIIAHRGASAYAPENTLAAFALALLQGADVIELDVRATSDGELVLLHDETLLRTTGDPRAVSEVTSAELYKLDDLVRPPTLTDVLDCFGDTTHYLLDVKHIPIDSERDLIDAVVDRRLRDRVVVQSFDHLLLRRLSLREPALALAALLAPEADAFRGLRLVSRYVTSINPCFPATVAPLVAFAHRRGVAVCPWTVNDDSDMQRLIDLNVDALITDVPDRARALVAARRPQGLQTRRDDGIVTRVTSPSPDTTPVSELFSQASP
jgi:glycerophosphoryl diester phosphodiesterase